MHAGTQLRDLIQKQGAALRLFEQPEPFGYRTRKCAARMAEQLRLHQVVGDRRAVQRAEPPRSAGAGGMDGPGDELLAGPAFPFDQHRKGRGRGPQHRVPDGFHHVAFADEIGDQGAGQLRRAMPFNDVVHGRRGRRGGEAEHVGHVLSDSGTPMDQ